jgi:hypothetical protein
MPPFAGMTGGGTSWYGFVVQGSGAFLARFWRVSGAFLDCFVGFASSQ